MIANLKKLRQEKGISQQKLADILLVTQQSVNKYENHNIEPDIVTLIKIAEYFNVSIDYLVGHTEIKEQIGEKQKSDLTNEERNLIKEYNKLNSKQKMCVLNVIENLKH